MNFGINSEKSYITRNSLKGDKEKSIALLSRAGTVNSYLLEIDKDISDWIFIRNVKG